MKKQIIITDLTRMQEGRVCIAGYAENGECIRPVLPPPGIHESMLKKNGILQVFPLSVTEFDLTRHIPDPPHTEDYEFNPKSMRFVKLLDEPKRLEILTSSLFPNVKAIFEVPVKWGPGYYILDGEGPRSLGTIRPRIINEVIIEKQTKLMIKVIFFIIVLV